MSTLRRPYHDVLLCEEELVKLTEPVWVNVYQPSDGDEEVYSRSCGIPQGDRAAADRASKGTLSRRLYSIKITARRP